MKKKQTRGASVWSRLTKSLVACQGGPFKESRQIIQNISAQGTFVGGLKADQALQQAGRILVSSKQVYRFIDSMVMEDGNPPAQRLRILCADAKAESTAPALLSNLFCVQAGDVQSLPPANFVKALLVDHDLMGQLPQIRHYVRRPVFDKNFRLLGPGWHAEEQTLVHGQSIDPVDPPGNMAAGVRACDRLPPHLQALLGEFCFRQDADLANAVGFFLTGLLSNHFVDDPHPMAIIDGNQPGLGKSLLVQVMGCALDGVNPDLTPLGKDEEMYKQLCTKLRCGLSSVIFFDNVRTNIDSPFIEQNVLAAEINLRKLSTNEFVTRPNNYLWAITSNQTIGTPDLISRSLPIRLYNEGPSRERRFQGDPQKFVQQHRQAILNELAGLVTAWVDRGQPRAKPQHRCCKWSAVIGGILSVVGLDAAFLANLDEVEEVMDADLQNLGALAEHVVTGRKRGFYGEVDGAEVGELAKDWVQVFRDAKVLADKLDEKQPRSQATAIGKFFSAKLGRPVNIQTPAGSRQAKILKKDAGHNQAKYWLQILPSPEASTANPERGPSANTPGPIRLLPIPPTPEMAASRNPHPTPWPVAPNNPDQEPANRSTTVNHGNDLAW